MTWATLTWSNVIRKSWSNPYGGSKYRRMSQLPSDRNQESHLCHIHGDKLINRLITISVAHMDRQGFWRRNCQGQSILVIKLMKAEQIFIIHHVLCFCRYCMEQTCLFEITMATHPFILRQERVMLKLSKKCLEKVRLYFGILYNQSYIKQMSLHLHRLGYFSKTYFFVCQLFSKFIRR